MWSFDDLFNKAAILARRGLDHSTPNSAEVPLWSFIALEMLARAVLSRTNVALLADPADGNNILFACGFPSTKSPKSIPSKTVFHRCTVICPGFTVADYETCMLWTNLRNEELHSGALPLDTLRSSEWMPKYFKISATLLRHLGKTLEDLFGAEHATAAETMIEALSEENKKKAAQEIKSAKDAFQLRTVEDRLQAMASGKILLEQDYNSRSRGYPVKCPSCEGPALVVGDIVRSTQPHDDDGNFVQEDVRIPVQLLCYSCKLELNGHSLLHAIGQGDQFTTIDYIDPKDYYGIEFDPDEYYDGGYMNC